MIQGEWLAHLKLFRSLTVSWMPFEMDVHLSRLCEGLYFLFPRSWALFSANCKSSLTVGMDLEIWFWVKYTTPEHLEKRSSNAELIQKLPRLGIRRRVNCGEIVGKKSCLRQNNLRLTGWQTLALQIELGRNLGCIAQQMLLFLEMGV